MILDTNALSAYADGAKGALRAVDRGESVEVPVVVVGEYRYGILQSNRRERHERWLREFLDQAKLLIIDGRTTHFYAQITIELRAAGRPIPSNDIWIAALARQHDLPILSRDAHFDRVLGIARLTW